MTEQEIQLLEALGFDLNSDSRIDMSDAEIAEAVEAALNKLRVPLELDNSNY